MTLLEFEEFLGKVRVIKSGEKLLPATIERYVQHISPYFKYLEFKKELDEIISVMNFILLKSDSPIIRAAFLKYLEFKNYDVESINGLQTKLRSIRKHANSSNSQRFLQEKLLSVQETRKLILEEKNLQLKCLYSCLYDTAARRSEIMNVKFGDIIYMDPRTKEGLSDMRKGIFAHVRICGKGKKSRTVYLHKTSLKLLIELHRGSRQNPDDFVFHFYKDKKHKVPFQNQTGQLYKCLVKSSKKIIKRSVHPHCLRHSCATHLADQGMDALGIASYLGHANLDAVMIYIHISSKISHRGISTYGKDLFEEAKT